MPVMHIPLDERPIPSNERPPCDAALLLIGWEALCRHCAVAAPTLPTREAACAWAAQHRQASGHTLEIAYVCDDGGQAREPMPQPSPSPKSVSNRRQSGAEPLQSADWLMLGPARTH
jgi:hypothetical protein